MKKITGGIYLVIDPRPGLREILPKLKSALEGGVDVIQLWNNWNPTEDHHSFIFEVCRLSHRYEVPVFLNENWQWLKTFPLDGIHFDVIPEDVNHIRNEIGRPLLMGITCGNNEDQIRWGIENKADYLSFCSMFPSSTSNSCELVDPSIIQVTSERTSIPIYAAGGITLKNTSLVSDLGVNGIAIASGIMKSIDPRIAVQQFKHCFINKNQVKPL
jgi:thiamine-phosphate pyrophosphorylase